MASRRPLPQRGGAGKLGPSALEQTMNPIPSDGLASEPHDQALCWPRLNLPGDGSDSSHVTPMARQVCEALERRLERLAACPLPPQVAEDVMDMWRDLDAAQTLLVDGPAEESRPDEAHRLLADLQAWLPVCESWIGVGRAEPVRWPVLMN
jgi:hypothetical protein